MKKKILFFTNGLYGGGAEQILLTLLTHIDYTLFNITLTLVRNKNKYIFLIIRNIAVKSLNL